jgi:hypothetical protein
MEELVNQLLDIIRQKDAKIDELTTLLLKQSGVIQSETKVIVPESQATFPASRRWPDVKRRLEEAFANKPGTIIDRPNFENLAEEASKEIENAG